MLLKQRVIEIIERALDELGPRPAELPIKIEYARDEKFGDYACTIAMDKRWRDAYAERDPSFANPRNFATALVAALESKPELAANFTKIEVAGAGFLNLTLSPALLGGYNHDARAEPESYGRSQSKTPRKILLEYVSANPTGPLNVVSARAAALGDACANLLAAAGEEVYREYYVNDYGNQVLLLGRSCLLRYLETRGVVLKGLRKSGDEDEDENEGEAGDGTPAGGGDEAGLPFPEQGYRGEYVKEVAAVIAADHPQALPDEQDVARLKKLSQRKDAGEEYAADPAIAGREDAWGRLAGTYLLATHRMDLEEFRVRFDNFFSERSLHEGGKVAAVRAKIERYVFEEDGKAVFRSTDFGDDKDRVIVREDGRPTYLLADIAYHHSKIERGYREIIDIWGPDHHGYIARLRGAMQALGFEGFQVKIAQQVNLLENGQPVKMGKRAGKFVTMEDLMEEIPVDVSRYFFVMRSFDSHLDFDFADARDTSEKNPYYYVAYAHARIRSIFRKTAERGLAPAPVEPGAVDDLELTPERRRLLWLAARFPEEVADCARDMEPHRLVTFLYQLATALSKFYGPKENRVIEQDARTAGQLLALLDAVAVCLKNGLALLGMEAPDRMTREESESDETES